MITHMLQETPLETAAGFLGKRCMKDNLEKTLLNIQCSNFKHNQNVLHWNYLKHLRFHVLWNLEKVLFQISKKKQTKLQRKCVGHSSKEWDLAKQGLVPCRHFALLSVSISRWRHSLSDISPGGAHHSLRPRTHPQVLIQSISIGIFVNCCSLLIHVC